MSKTKDEKKAIAIASGSLTLVPVWLALSIWVEKQLDWAENDPNSLDGLPLTLMITGPFVIAVVIWILLGVWVFVYEKSLKMIRGKETSRW